MKVPERGVVKCFQFGPFRLDRFDRTLIADGRRLALPSKAFDTLMVLVENRGTVVDKKTLMELVWPDTTVEENNLAQGIGAIRKALGEQAGDQRYVLTVPGQGYSFIAEVNEERPPEPAPIRPRKSFSIARLSVSAVLIAALAAAVIWISGSRPSQQPRLVPLTGFNNEDGVFAFSPDGDRVAYGWYPRDGGASGIYVKVVGAGDPLPLATGMGQRGPAWSPDGRYIAYYRQPPGVYLIPALGGAERKLTSISNVERLRGMGWSPDGKHLAISDRDPDTGFLSIFELTVDTGERRKLTSALSTWGDTSPAYSPDGKSLGFIRYPIPGSSAVFMIPAAGGEPRQLTRFEESAYYSFDWTPNGREIVYSALIDGNAALWRVSVSGGPPRRIVDAGFDAIGPAVAKSGKRLAFWQARETVNLWRFDFDRSSQPRKLAPNLRRQTSPQYSPDGSKLVFKSNRLNGDEIWISDNEGRNLMALTSMEKLRTFAGSPQWSPDGLEIAFDSQPGANADIYVVNSQGGSPRRITSDPAEDANPSFSRDGRYISFNSNRSGSFQIWKVARTGGDAAQVTRQGGVAGLESMDGKYLYYINYQHANQLWRVPAAGGAEEMVFEGASFWKRYTWRTYGVWWTIGAAGIVFVDRDSSVKPTVWSIKRFDPETRAISTLATIPHSPGAGDPCVTISPDGRSVVYSQIEESTMTIMLLENFR